MEQHVILFTPAHNAAIAQERTCHNLSDCTIDLYHHTGLFRKAAR